MSSWCFFIGPGKTGSTWLYENLLNHPEIKLPKNIKETNYYLKGTDYNDLHGLFFNYNGNRKINFDISNTYIYNPKVASRIKKNHPEAKIIIGYREPLDRLISMYLFKRRNGEIPLNIDLKEALKNDNFKLIEHSKYYTLASHYQNLFGRDNIFIFDFHKIKNSPESLLRELFSFLEVDHFIEDKTARKVINPASQYRIQFLSKYSTRISNFLRNNGFLFLLNFIKTNKVIQRLLFKTLRKDERLIIDEQTKKLFQLEISSDLKKFKSNFLR